jgi:RNA polymerase-binding transcription factor DksA
MADHDDATDLENLERETAIAKRVIYTGESAQDCIECGYGIDSRRQLAVPGCQMCTDCANELELRNKRR